MSERREHDNEKADGFVVLPSGAVSFDGDGIDVGGEVDDGALRLAVWHLVELWDLLRKVERESGVVVEFDALQHLASQCDTSAAAMKLPAEKLLAATREGGRERR